MISANKLTDPSREPHASPCPDCGRIYMNGENVRINVPDAAGGFRAAWSGCVDCWVLRTEPK